MKLTDPVVDGIMSGVRWFKVVDIHLQNPEARDKWLRLGPWRILCDYYITTIRFWQYRVPGSNVNCYVLKLDSVGRNRIIIASRFLYW